MRNLVFLPSLLCNQDIFNYQKNLLEKKYKDLKIHIFVFTNVKNIEDASSHVLEKLNNEDFGLLGISMGGYIAMDIMKKSPQNVKKLCFMNTFWDIDLEEKRLEREQSINFAEKIEDSNFTGVNDKILASYLHNMKEEDVSLIKNMAKDIGKEGFINQQKLILSRKSSIQDFPNYNIPVLCIGSDNDFITPSFTLAKMAESCNGKFVSIPNCGHLSLLDQKEATYSLIDFWLQ